MTHSNLKFPCHSKARLLQTIGEKKMYLLLACIFTILVSRETIAVKVGTEGLSSAGVPHSSMNGNLGESGANENLVTFEYATNKLSEIVNKVKGADRSGKTNRARLYGAITEKNSKLVRSIIETEQDLDTLDEEGLAPLHVASFYPDNCDVIQELLGAGANVSSLSKAKQTVVHFVVAGLAWQRTIHPLYYHPSANLNCLLKYGANLDMSDAHGMSPLMYLVSLILGSSPAPGANENYPIEQLLSFGASLEPLTRFTASSRITLLEQALSRGVNSLGNYLLPLSSPAEVQQLYLTEAAFQSIFMRSESDLIRDLLKKGYKPDKVKSARPITPLMIAITSGNYEAAQTLIDAGADIDISNHLGTTPLMLAAGSHRTLLRLSTTFRLNAHRILDLLIGRGAELDRRDIQGDTALMHAASQGDEVGVQLLVTAGADVNIRNNLRQTVMDLDDRMAQIIVAGSKNSESIRRVRNDSPANIDTPIM